MMSLFLIDLAIFLDKFDGILFFAYHWFYTVDKIF